MTFATLSALAEEFLALRRSAARRDPRYQGHELRNLRHKEKLLRGFLRYWRSRGLPWPIPSSLLLDWIALGADRQHPFRVGWTPRLRQLNKTLFAVRCRLLDRQDHCNAF